MGSWYNGLRGVTLAADTKAWEVDTLRGHVNNVSCVMFHARQVGSAYHTAFFLLLIMLD